MAPYAPHARYAPVRTVKITIIGGAGVRVPLLAGGLSRSDLRISELALYDIDQDRLGVIAGLAVADGERRKDHDRGNT